MKIFSTLGIGLLCAASAAAQSGGNYTITQAVISNGGDTSSAGPFSVTGTIGQPLAGGTSSSGNFGLNSGFWAASPNIVTAASVGVSGRVLDAAGAPLRNAVITMTNSSGVVIVTRTNNFGYFYVEDVEAGDAYVVTVDLRSHHFAPQVIMVRDSISGLEFRSLD